MSTQPIPNSAQESSVVLHPPMPRNTPATAAESHSISWQEVRPGKTVNVPTDTDLIRFPKRPTRVERQAALPLVAAVHGTVTEVHANTVRCSVNTQDKLVELTLLPELFPEPPRFGMTFELAMITVSGVQQPSLKVRQPSIADDDLSRQADELLAVFR